MRVQPSVSSCSVAAHGFLQDTSDSHVWVCKLPFSQSRSILGWLMVYKHGSSVLSCTLLKKITLKRKKKKKSQKETELFPSPLNTYSIPTALDDAFFMLTAGLSKLLAALRASWYFGLASSYFPVSSKTLQWCCILKKLCRLGTFENPIWRINSIYFVKKLEVK